MVVYKLYIRARAINHSAQNATELDISGDNPEQVLAQELVGE